MRRALWPLVLLLAGCPAKKPISAEDRVAIVFTDPEGTPLDHPLAKITVGDIDLALARKRFEREGSLRAKELPKALRKHTIESMIDTRLLAMEAERLKVKTTTTAVARELEAFREGRSADEFRRALIENFQTEAEFVRAIERQLTEIELLKREAMKDVEPSMEAVKARFESMPPEERTRPERVRARQIMVTTEEEAQAIHKDLTWRKKDFAETAKRVSIGPEARRGGEVGWFQRGQMPEVFDESCFPLQPEEISPVMASELGFHICQLLEREPERPLTFDEAAPRLKRTMRVEAERAAKKAYKERLRGKVQIRYLDAEPLDEADEE
ncbi:MAG: peptidylprolyl isomerase [Deltaproteobacteria bacterium]